MIPNTLRIALFWLLAALASWTGQLAAQPAPPLTERVYVHLGRDLYLAGESADFSMLVADARILQPSGQSAVGYLSLLQRGGTVVWQGKVALTGGKGQGSIPLAESLPSGWYQLVGYTRWMRAEGESSFFRSWIRVVNPENMPSAEPGGQAQLSLTAEGGVFAEGVNNRIIISLTGPDGKGLEVKGMIRVRGGAEVASFATDVWGMGQTWVTPEAGVTYEAVVTALAGLPLVAALPEVRGGIALTLTDNGPTYGLQLASTQSLAGYGVKIYAKNTLWYQTAWPAGTDGIQIPSASLTEGVHLLQVTDSNRKTIASRYFFISPEKEQKPALALSQSPETGISIHPEWKNGPATVSVKAGLSHSPFPSFHEYLSLWADLPQALPFPFRQGAAGQWDAASLDLALGAMPAPSQEAFAFTPERHGHEVFGQLTNALNQPLRGTSVFLSVPRPQPWVKHAETDSNGRFMMVLEHSWRQVPAVIWRAEVEGAYTLELTPSFATLTPEAFWPELRLSSQDIALANRLYQGVQVKKAYAVPCNPEEKSSVPFFGKPNTVYRMDDFVAMPAEDLIREVVAEAFVEVKKKEKQIVLARKGMQTTFTEQPLLLLDGVPVFNAEAIFSVLHRNLDRMEVVNEMYSLQGRVFPGILHVVTRPGDFSFGTLTASDQRMFFRLFLPEPAPPCAADAPDDRVPDFGNELALPPLSQPTKVTWPLECRQLWFSVAGWDAEGNVLGGEWGVKKD